MELIKTKLFETVKTELRQINPLSKLTQTKLEETKKDSKIKNDEKLQNFLAQLFRVYLFACSSLLMDTDFRKNNITVLERDAHLWKINIPTLTSSEI